MSVEQTGSLLWILILQISWWLAAMLPLAVAGIVIAFVLRSVNRQARAIEKKPIESKPGGFVRLLHDKFTHQALSQSILFILFGGLALGGLVGLYLQQLVQPGVQKTIESGSLLKQDINVPINSGPSLDFILFLSLLVGAVMVALAVHTYRSLCRDASEIAVSLRGREAPRPFLVKWFYDNRKIGLVALIIGGWICFGFIMQVVGFIVVVVHWPTGLTDVSFLWTTNIVIWILGAVGVLLFLAPFALAIWMGIRHFKLEVRYYQGNSTFRLIVNVATALGAGLFGSLLFMYLLDRLGIAPISGKWFDIVPALWPLAFLIAYATALLIQVFIVHYRNRDFTVVNIAIALIVAVPGSVPVYSLLFSLLANFLSRLLGIP